MAKKILLPAIFLFCSSAVLSQNNIALFDQCNYSGKAYYLTPGSYKGYAMQVGNDKLSSMQIPNGMRVTIYEHDDFKGRSATYTDHISCLTDGWNDNVSSMVVENLYGNDNQQNYSYNDYVTFYNDCYSKGFSKSLRPGTYYGNQLGILKMNISSFAVFGNLRVRVYLNNDNASGYSVNFDASQTCLTSTYNDRIRSLVIEYKPVSPTYQQPNNQGNNNSYATIYTDCNYAGNSLRLAPGYYQGDKLGLLRYDISSIELPSNLRAKVFVNNEYLSGSSYTLTENSSCLSQTLNNKIGSLVIEEYNGYNNNNNNNNNGYSPYQQNNNQKVTIYSDNNYKGLSASLLPGTYATMAQAGFIDNNLSSLTVPQGYRVVLYDLENFQGKNYTITASKTGFTLSGWNDRASSIAVYRE